MSYRRNARRRAIHANPALRHPLDVEAAQRYHRFWRITEPARQRVTVAESMARAERRDTDQRARRGFGPRKIWARIRAAVTA